MARIRTVKPEFFRHEGLYEAERETGLPLRVAYAGLWTATDREGRFRWAPRQLKLDCLPFDDVDFSRVLDALATRGFIVKYAKDGKEYGYIPSWRQHQIINTRERASELPDPETCQSLADASATREARVTETHVHAQGEGKGREGKDAASTTRPKVSRETPETDEAQLFERGKKILGQSAGGMIAQLLKAKQNSVALARAAIEQASTKQNPREYIGRIIRGPPDERHGAQDPLAGIL